MVIWLDHNVGHKAGQILILLASSCQVAKHFSQWRWKCMSMAKHALQGWCTPKVSLRPSFWVSKPAPVTVSRHREMKVSSLRDSATSSNRRRMTRRPTINRAARLPSVFKAVGPNWYTRLMVLWPPRSLVSTKGSNTRKGTTAMSCNARASSCRFSPAAGDSQVSSHDMHQSIILLDYYVNT